MKPVPFQYPAMDTPQHTLLNLKYAWERRDSVRTREVYSDDYIGTAMNPDPQGVAFTFTKNQEVAVVWALGKDPDVTGTFMDLKPEGTWTRMRFSGDPPGWETIMLLRGVALEVISTNTTLRAQNSDILFKFEPTLDSTSPTDTTWRIVRWEEAF